MARTDTITYITFHTTNDASDFGDTSVVSTTGGAVSSTTRAVNALGNSAWNVMLEEIEYVTVDSTGNSADFGNQINSGHVNFSSHTDGTRGEWWAGSADGSYAAEEVQYITIASTGNAADSGNATVDGFIDNSGSSGT